MSGGDPHSARYGDYAQITQLLTALAQKLAPHRDGRPAVAAFPLMFGAATFAHRVQDPWMIQSVYDPDIYQVFLVTPALTPALRAGVLAAATQKAVLVESDQLHALMVRFFQSPIAAPITLEIDGLTILGLSFWRLLERAFAHQRSGRPFFKPDLDARAAETFTRVARDGGLDLKAPFVLFHMREAGYKNVDPAAVSQTIVNDERANQRRNGDIATCIPAMRALRDRGYQIVRIGDRTMKRLPADLGDGIFDWADAGTIAEVGRDDNPGRGVEAQLAARSAFMVCAASGPSILGMLYGKPMLLHNVVPNAASILGPETWMSFSKILRTGDKTPLSFRELIETRLIDTWSHTEIYQRGFEIEQHSPEMIQDLTLALADKVEGRLHPDDIEPTSKQYRQAALRADDQRRSRGIDAFLEMRAKTRDDAIARIPLYFASESLSLPKIYTEHAENFLDG